jgi:hypothetical protein
VSAHGHGVGKIVEQARQILRHVPQLTDCACRSVGSQIRRTGTPLGRLPKTGEHVGMRIGGSSLAVETLPLDPNRPAFHMRTVSFRFLVRLFWCSRTPDRAHHI